MREAVDDLRLEGHDQIRVEVRWVPHAQGQRSAALGGLRMEPRRRERRAGQDQSTQGQKITTREVHIRQATLAQRVGDE